MLIKNVLRWFSLFLLFVFVALLASPFPAKAANGKLWNIHVDRGEFYSARKCKETANRLTLDRINQDMRLCGICVSVCPIGQVSK